MDTLKFEHHWGLNRHTLLCPLCGGNYLHHKVIETFERCEDAEEGMHTTITRDRVDVKYEPLVDNPSPRRDGLKIEFYCEFCGNQLTLVILQHKGETWVGWDVDD